MSASSFTFCLAEDRPRDEVGLRLALLTLRDFSPRSPVIVFRHEPSDAFRAFVRDLPQVTLFPRRPAGASSWNCKPQTLLEVLDRGVREAVWLDSDLALARPCAHLFAGLGPETVVVAEEMRSSKQPGSLVRTRGWGLVPGRLYPVTMNSCVVRVTDAHRPLLVRWQELLGDARYRAAQQAPILQRPVWFQSDQDVLNALLGSQEFAGVPVRFLKRGRDIIHSSGLNRSYSLRERLGGLCGQPIPPFLHNPAAKAWHALDPAEPAGRYRFAERLNVETSPYVALARKYAAHLGPDTEWLRHGSPLGRVLRALGCGHYALRGMPAALALTLLGYLRQLARFRA